MATWPHSIDVSGVWELFWWIRVWDTLMFSPEEAKTESVSVGYNKLSIPAGWDIISLCIWGE